MKRKAESVLAPQNKRIFRKHDNSIAKITFLGTASAIPTTRRNMSAMCMTLLDGNGILVDCAEATQHQFLRSTLKPAHVSCICITHLHGDHCYGLFGFLHTLSQHTEDAENREMLVIGPKGIKELLYTVFRLSGGTPFRDVMEIIELDHSDAQFVTEYKGIKISAAPLKHRVPTYGYVFEESEKRGALDGRKAIELGAKNHQLGELKDGRDVTLKDGKVIRSADVLGAPTPGRKISILWDTYDSTKAESICANSDLMIHEATYDHCSLEKALAHSHSTAKMAGEFAAAMNAKMLILTHFSPRYEPDEKELKEVVIDDLQKEAAAVSNCPVFCARDWLCFHSVKKGGFTLCDELAIKNPDFKVFAMHTGEEEFKNYVANYRTSKSELML